MKEYFTNVFSTNGVGEVVKLNDEMLKELWLSYEDGQGYLLNGYFCEEVTKNDKK